ncbi:hypothetical protein [Vibrio phage pTD1]|uniref:Uncharacterized protein n=1 Tax=Vibrio phage pTD1 TaxID=1938577 RepID=A0A1Q2U2M0_9CAUD|nr:hypothetical protein FDH33_gp008 [Vibrio phage pTD1]BAW98217.1 hypothetical protein [Vibrio phage pTD1]
MDKHTELFLEQMAGFCEMVQHQIGHPSGFPAHMRAILSDARLPKEFQCMADENRVGFVNYGFNQGGALEWGEKTLPNDKEGWGTLIFDHASDGWSLGEEHVVLDLGWCKARRPYGRSGWLYLMNNLESRHTAPHSWMEPNAKLTNHLNQRIAGLLGILPGFFEEDAKNDHHAAVKAFKNSLNGTLNALKDRDQPPFLTRGKVDICYGWFDTLFDSEPEHASPLNRDAYFLTLSRGCWRVYVCVDRPIKVYRRVGSKWEEFNFEDIRVCKRKVMEDLMMVLDNSIDLKSTEVHPTVKSLKAVNIMRPDFGLFPITDFTVRVSDQTGTCISRAYEIFSKEIMPYPRLSELKKVTQQLGTQSNLKGDAAAKVFEGAVRVTSEHIKLFAADHGLKFEINEPHFVNIYLPDGEQVYPDFSANVNNIPVLVRILETLGGYKLKNLHTYEGDLAEKLTKLRANTDDRNTRLILTDVTGTVDHDRIMNLVERLCDKGTIVDKHLYSIFSNTNY